MSKIFLLFLLLFSIYKCSTTPKCLNPEGKAVDFYVIFLFPTSSSGDKKLHYAYYDNNSEKLKDYIYDEETFPPTRITRFVTEGTLSTINYFFWNDDRATKEDSSSRSCPKTMAHAKGSLVYNKHSGVFLQHSLPRFPTRNMDNEVLTELPSNSGLFGQHFLCVSVSTQTANNITQILNYEYVSVNHGSKTDNVNNPHNEWVHRLIENDYDKSWPIDGKYEISSLGGRKFDIHLRSYRVDYVPFNEPIMSYYHSSFLVRTWTRPAISPSKCGRYKLLNVNEVRFLGSKEKSKHNVNETSINATDTGYFFPATKEHSKWAVAMVKPYVCFSDINHTDAQKNRGGSIICFEDNNLAEIMRKSVESREECDYPEKKEINDILNENEKSIKNNLRQK